MIVLESIIGDVPSIYMNHQRNEISNVNSCLALPDKDHNDYDSNAI